MIRKTVKILQGPGSILALVFFTCMAFSQQQATHWCFGDSAHLVFTDSGVISAEQSSIFSNESFASISDDEGNLLLYSNGRHIWNRAHEFLPNGHHLHIKPDDLTVDVTYSTTQGTTILPRPGYPDQYYVLTNVPWLVEDEGLYYCLVDMNLDGGLGDVVATEKNVMLIDGRTSEKMKAVRHANGRDWWILTFEIPIYPSTDSIYHRLLLTPAGFSAPSTQQVGFNTYPGAGELEFSHQGDLMATTGYGQNSIEVREFDRCTGLIGERILLDTIHSGTPYGCEFSPSGQFLYVSYTANRELVQYDLWFSSDSSNRRVIYRSPVNYASGQLQMAPDGKIYIADTDNIWPTSLLDTITMTIAVINEPDLIGSSCNYDTTSIWLGGRRAFGGLPNMPNYALGALVGSPCDTLDLASGLILTESDDFTIYPNPALDYLVISNEENFPVESMEIFNSLGKLVGRFEIDAYTQTIPVRNLPSGTYWVVTQSQTGSRRASFVKQ